MARLASSACAVVVFCLAAASAAEASPGSPCAHQPRARKTAHTIDARATPLRKVMRRLKALSTHGLRMRRARAGLLFDFSPRLHHNGTPRSDDDSNAIQNDGTISVVDATDRDVLGLRPLGIVVGSADGRCVTLTFSPRSPRGPPQAG